MRQECDKIYNIYNESNGRWDRLEPSSPGEFLGGETPEQLFHIIEGLSFSGWFVTQDGDLTERAEELNYAIKQISKDKHPDSIASLADMIDENSKRNVEGPAYHLQKFIAIEVNNVSDYLDQCDMLYQIALKKYSKMEPLPTRVADGTLVDVASIYMNIWRCAVLNGWACRDRHEGWRLYVLDCWTPLSKFIMYAGLEYSKTSLKHDKLLIEMLREKEPEQLTDFSF